MQEQRCDFLTAYFSVTGQHKILTGTSRMKERPIGHPGERIKNAWRRRAIHRKEGYPPLETKAFKGQSADAIKIRGDVSSQFISALMMIAPVLPQGLKLELEGKIGSRPYIEMTASIMKHFGAEVSFEGNMVKVSPKSYNPASFTVESDWSAASYWFAFTAFANEAEIILQNCR